MNTEKLFREIQQVDPPADLLRRIELRIAGKSLTVSMRTVYRVAASFLIVALLECVVVFNNNRQQPAITQQVDNQIYK